MNLNQLKYFSAVCTYQTISDAAAYLHISQPSLSSAIKELEKEFGVVLFRRHHRGMVLTPEGETLLRMSRDVLSLTEHMEKVMKDMGQERKILRLGVPPMIGSLILPHIYHGFHSAHPDVELEITEGGREELQKRLSDDFLDMIFIPHNRVLEPKFSSINVSKLEIVFCVTEAHSMANKKSVSVKELADIPLVLFKNGFYQTEEIKHLFSVSGVTPNILLQTEQLSTIQTIISNNVAAGFLFRQLIDKVPDLVSLPTTPAIYVDVSLVWKKDAYLFSSMKKFRDYIKTSTPFESCNNAPNKKKS
ncbi:MAG: LysR family transcriptional regulator [Ruminococcaceae bacterium]|nr:LysR family transcriptional regulator [Oscillospiraceae bacterium]